MKFEKQISQSVAEHNPNLVMFIKTRCVTCTNKNVH